MEALANEVNARVEKSLIAKENVSGFQYSDYELDFRAVYFLYCRTW
jgi:hypothetical protein